MSSKDAGTYLKIEWLNQHGCGENNTKLRCNLILQAMCQPMSIQNNEDRMRDGTSTSTQNYRGANGKSIKLLSFGSTIYLMNIDNLKYSQMQPPEVFCKKWCS